MQITRITTIFTLAAVFAFAAPTFASEITGGLSNQGITPVVPSSISATKTGDTQVTVSWSAVAGVSGYLVHRIKDGATAVQVATSTGTSFVNSSLADGLYSYQVQSFVGTLASEFSSPTAPLTIDTTPTSSSSGGGGGGGSYATPTPTPTPTPGPLSEAAQKVDINDDGAVDILDFNTLMVNWGSTSIDNVVDFNDDNKVDIFDFNLLMINWSG